MMKKIFTLLVFWGCYHLHGYGQNPELIKDISSLQPTNVLSDGTLIGLQNCTFDQDPASADMAPPITYKLNGAAVFFANDGKGKRGLWRTDGTKSGTYLVSSLNAPLSKNISIGQVYSTDSCFYFEVDSVYMKDGAAVSAFEGLWKSDGTSNGTVPVFSGHDKYLRIGGSGYKLYGATIGKMFYFIGGQQIGDTTYTNIYKTDGTAAGTKVYFAVDKEANVGVEGAVGSAIFAQLVSFNNKIYFNYANPVGNTAYQLWVGDGVTPPHLLTPAAPGNYIIYQWANINNKYLLMLGYVGTGANETFALMRLNATDAAPVVLEDNIDTLANFSLFRPYTDDYITNGNLVYFHRSNTSIGATNGEKAGTYKISMPYNYIIAGACTKGVVFTAFGSNSLANAKTYIWDGLSATSYKILSDSLSPGVGAIGRIVQFDTTLLAFSSDDEHTVWQVGLNTPYCYRVNRLQPAGDGAMINDSTYIVLGESSPAGQTFATGVEPQLIRKAKKIWTGALSTDWNNKGNWLPQTVPTPDDDVVIAPVKNSPVVTANAACKSLTIQYNPLTINKGANLDVYGYLANYTDISGAGSITRKGTGKEAGLTFGAGSYNIDSINLNGADFDLTSMNYYYPNAVTLNSVINFKSGNKLVMNTGSLNLTKKPFFTGFNADRYIVNNRLITSVALGLENDNAYNSVNLGGFGVSSASPGDSVLTVPIGTASSYAPMVYNFPFQANSGSLSVSVTDTVRKHGITGDLVKTNIVNKSWVLSTQFTGPTNTSFFWAAGNEAPGFNRNACFVAWYNGTKWVNGPTQAAVLKNGLYSVNLPTPYGTETYTNYPFAVCSNINALPVTLTGFTAQLSKDVTSTLLSWQTTTEINTAWFTVQRSADGIHFNDVGKLPAAGNSATQNVYQYTDGLETLNPLPGIIYYRLQTTDKDGIVAFSNIILLKTGTSWQVKLITNPVNNVITFYSATDVNNALVQLIDMQGKVLKQLNLTITAGQQVKIPSYDIAKGMYILTITANKERREYKVLKQ